MDCNKQGSLHTNLNLSILFLEITYIAKSYLLETNCFGQRRTKWFCSLCDIIILNKQTETFRLCVELIHENLRLTNVNLNYRKSFNSTGINIFDRSKVNHTSFYSFCLCLSLPIHAHMQSTLNLVFNHSTTQIIHTSFCINDSYITGNR